MRETGPRGAVLVTATDGEIEGASRVVLDVVRWEHLRINVSGCQHMDELAANTEGELGRVVAGSGDRTVAVRVTLAGATPLHGELFGRERDVRANVLAAAAGLGVGSIWIEKVRVETTPAVEDSVLLARADAVAEFGRCLARRA